MWYKLVIQRGIKSSCLLSVLLLLEEKDLCPDCCGSCPAVTHPYLVGGWPLGPLVEPRVNLPVVAAQRRVQALVREVKSVHQWHSVLPAEHRVALLSLGGYCFAGWENKSKINLEGSFPGFSWKACASFPPCLCWGGGILLVVVPQRHL